MEWLERYLIYFPTRYPEGLSREAAAATRAGWLRDGQVVPYLARLADLVYTLARWQEGQHRPMRAER